MIDATRWREMATRLGMTEQAPIQRLWKVTGKGGAAFHGGTGTWPLPKGNKPGAWLEVEGKLRPCRNGLHLCRDQDLLNWLGPVIWRVEAKGEQIQHSDKIVVRKARLVAPTPWNERIARLFAADCAERVLPLFEKVLDDERPRKAIETARRFANDEASRAEMSTAHIAARGAGEKIAHINRDRVAYTVAESAADSASNGEAYRSVYMAANSAAESVAYSVTDFASFLSERHWQTERLIAYLTGEVGV